MKCIQDGRKLVQNKYYNNEVHIKLKYQCKINITVMICIKEYELFGGVK